jgi:cellular nucleic acid-binding protein
MSTNIYILKLDGENYYIGKTNNVDKRFAEHLSGKGSIFTKKYKPIKIEKVIPNASPFDEDRYVKEYMAKYGINKVRGGSYVTEELDDNQEYNLKKEIWAANDCCTQCGRKGHFVKDCYSKTDINGEDIFNCWECEYCEKEFEDENECEKHEKICKNKKSVKTCFQCGETGHYSNVCPNEEETFNCRYCDKEFESQKGATFHENVYCKSKGKSVAKKNGCYRCGRQGHHSNDCYARTNIDGYELDLD